MTIRFYAADLAAYNSGRLHGVWIEATSDAEEMQEQVAAMLAASPVADAEEWLIHDYDDELKAISHLGETSDLEKVAAIMEAVEELEDEHDAKRLPLLLDWIRDKEDDPALWASELSDAYAGEYSDPEDYAAEILAEQVKEIPESLRGYFDFKAYARDLALGGEMDFVCIHTGNHLQDYDSMRGRECIALHNR